MDGNLSNGTPNRLQTMNDNSKAFNNMLDSYCESLNPIEVVNERSAAKEAESLLCMFESSKGWTEQLSSIQRGMSLVQGGICSYTGFTSQLTKIATFLIPCVSSIRSTLVKYSCMFIAQMAKTLKDKFEFSAETLISTLFQCTTNATKIISNTCKQTILVIMSSCQSRKILLFMANEIKSKSQVHRNIVCESLRIVINDWKQTIVQNSFKEIEKYLNLLINDSGLEAREITKDNIQIYIKKFPERKLILLNQLDNKNKQKIMDSTSTNKIKSSEKYPVTFKNLEPYLMKESNNADFQIKSKQQNEEKNNNLKFGNVSPIQKKSIYKVKRARSPTRINETTTKNKKFDYDQRAETTLDLSKLYKSKMDELLNNLTTISPKKVEENVFNSPGQQMQMRSNSEDKTSIALKFESNDKSPVRNINTNENKITTISKLRKPRKINFSENEIFSNGQTNYEVEEIKPISILKNKKEKESENQEKKNNDAFLAFTFKEGNENVFIDSVRKAKAESDNAFIEKNANDIADGFMQCFKSTNENILISAFNLFLEILPIISYAFSYYLDDLITILLDKANQTKSIVSLNASAVLRAISSQYSGEILLFIGLKCSPTPPLLSFAANIVRKNESVLTQNEISKELLTVCCVVYESTVEQKFSALSVGLLNKIKEVNSSVFQAFANSVDENWKNLLRSLHLYVPNESNSEGNRLPVRVFPQIQRNENQEQRLESILHLIDESENKYEPIFALQQFFEETKGKYFIPAIPYFVGLIRSSYYLEIENCLLTLTKFAHSTTLVNEIINYFVGDPSTSSVNVLSIIIKCSKSKDLSPRIDEIIDKLTPLLTDKSAEIRKSAIFCFVEMRSIIGKPFDSEIDKLPSISRKMIFFFFNKYKIQNNC